MRGPWEEGKEGKEAQKEGGEEGKERGEKRERKNGLGKTNFYKQTCVKRLLNN